MGTKGVIGYKTKGKLRAFYNRNDSYYSYLGVKCLAAFHKYSAETIRDFFINRVKFIGDPNKNPEKDISIFDLDWGKERLTVLDETDFLEDGLYCEYGYIYDVDNDTLEVFKGFFTKPQSEIQVKMDKLKKIFHPDDDKYFTHRVLTIQRDEIKVARELFLDEDTLDYADVVNGKKSDYPEREYINHFYEKS